VVEEEVWGMIWQTECLARIDPADGTVLGWIDMDGIGKHTRKQTTVQAELRGAPPTGPPGRSRPSPVSRRLSRAPHRNGCAQRHRILTDCGGWCRPSAGAVHPPGVRAGTAKGCSDKRGAGSR
jgi:hypothetical protein